MSVRALAWAFEQEVDATAKLVLLALSDHVSEDGDCWVSMRTLEAKTSLKERAIQLACRRLESLGLIRKSPRFQGDRQTTNLWEVLWRTVAKDPHPTALNAPPLVAHPPHEMRGEGALNAPPGAHQMHPINHSKEPTTKPTTPPLPPKGGRGRKKRAIDPIEFDALIPLTLQTPEFLNTWHEWVQERAGNGKAMTELAAKKTLAMLAKEAATPEVAIQWIEKSIRNNWTGVFPDRVSPKSGSQVPNLRQSADDALVRQIQARKATQGGVNAPANW